jgi:hypothetical protein
MMLRRRRVPRQSADWFGKCLVEDDPAAAWHECRVIDVSLLGAGIEVFGFARRDVVGERLAVEVEDPAGSSFMVRFVGEIKNVRDEPRGRVRLGLEFLDLSTNERAIIDLLQQMRMNW